MSLLQVWQFPHLQIALPRNDEKRAEAVAEESGASMCQPGELALPSSSESPVSSLVCSVVCLLILLLLAHRKDGQTEPGGQTAAQGEDGQTG